MHRAEKIAILVVLILHIVGLIGISNPALKVIFIPLSPIIIIVSLAISLMFNITMPLKNWLVLIVIGVVGFIIEVAGVSTGKIFGEYVYGKTLGPGFWGVPLVIGINWLALSYYCRQISFFKHNWRILNIPISALLMTLFDVALEPSAIQLDFWQWNNNTIPFQNYVAWFAVSLIFQALLNLMKIEFKSRSGAWIFAIQFGFFSLLLLLL